MGTRTALPSSCATPKSRPIAMWAAPARPAGGSGTGLTPRSSLAAWQRPPRRSVLPPVRRRRPAGRRPRGVAGSAPRNSVLRKPGMSPCLNSRWTDDEDIEIGRRRHGGAARRPGDRRQLAEVVPAVEDVDVSVRPGSRWRCLQDDEELPAEPPLARMISPASMVRRSASRTTSASCSSVHSASQGTRCKRSRSAPSSALFTATHSAPPAIRPVI